MIINHHSQKGFTLVEMIVSLAVFSVVITIAVGALLSLIATNQQLQAEQSVMTNLSFALDSMTREIRTGTSYYCETSNSNINNIFDGTVDLNNDGTPGEKGLDIDEVADCAGGRFPANNNYQGLAFIETGTSITGIGGRILYFFDESEGKIYRRVGDGEAQSIVSSGIVVTNAEFFVTGSDRLSAGGDDQASVTVFIEAHETNDTKSYRIQTTVTQRTLDI